jgi:hypothetical protein
MSSPREPSVERRAWPTIASCALAVCGLTAFFATTSLNLEFTYGGPDHSSFGFNFQSGMDWWYHFTVIAVLAAGAVLGVLGGLKGRPLRPLAWAAFVVNAIAAVILGAFILIAYLQSRAAP